MDKSTENLDYGDSGNFESDCDETCCSKKLEHVKKLTLKVQII